MRSLAYCHFTAKTATELRCAGVFEGAAILSQVSKLESHAPCRHNLACNDREGRAASRVSALSRLRPDCLFSRCATAGQVRLYIQVWDALTWAGEKTK